MMAADVGLAADTTQNELVAYGVLNTTANIAELIVGDVPVDTLTKPMTSVFGPMATVAPEPAPANKLTVGVPPIEQPGANRIPATPPAWIQYPIVPVRPLISIGDPRAIFSAPLIVAVPANDGLPLNVGEPANVPPRVPPPASDALPGTDRLMSVDNPVTPSVPPTDSLPLTMDIPVVLDVDVTAVAVRAANVLAPTTLRVPLIVVEFSVPGTIVALSAPNDGIPDEL